MCLLKAVSFLSSYFGFKCIHCFLLHDYRAQQVVKTVWDKEYGASVKSC